MATIYPGMTNSPATTLSAGIAIDATTIPLVDSSVLPAGPNICTIGEIGDETAETIYYTGKSGNSLTGVVRGYDTTGSIGAAKAWSTGTRVARNFTKLDLDALQDHVENINDPHGVYNYEGKKFVINTPYASGGVNSYKGQLHCHSTGSDGVDTPTDLVNAYKTAGYNFITITDHDVVTSDPGVSGITWLCDSTEETSNRDIVAYDIASQTDDYTVQEVIDYHLANNSMTSIAHPYLSGVYLVEENELAEYRDYNFIEVYNSLSIETGESQWDYALSSGKKVFGTAVDDCHDIAGASFNKGWVVVFADSNTADNIKIALRKGNFYASTGNDIDISVSGKTITATSSVSSNFTFVGRNGRVLKTENGVTSSSYTINGNELYVRAKSVKVSDSTIAWSQPIFIDYIGDDGRQFSDIRSHNNSVNKLINGNFDIWQRGTSLTYSSSCYLADRWGFYISADGGTNPTITLSRQINAGIDKSYYYHRITVDAAGSSYGASSGGGLYQPIEHGTRYLCGKGKTVTISFYARSDIVNKKLGLFLVQNYGTGGTPSSQEIINGSYVALTSAWIKYKITITTNTLLGKIFGTDNNDKLTLQFYHIWGTSTAGRVGDTVAESFVGTGNIDIAQVQLCSGDKTLPFIPKTFEEELRTCQRYYEKSYDYNDPPGTATQAGNVIGQASNAVAPSTANTMVAPCHDVFKVTKRTTPIVTIYSTDGTANAILVADATNRTGVTAGLPLSTKSPVHYLNIDNTSSTEITDRVWIRYHWTANAEF